MQTEFKQTGVRSLNQAADSACGFRRETSQCDTIHSSTTYAFRTLLGRGVIILTESTDVQLNNKKPLP